MPIACAEGGHGLPIPGPSLGLQQRPRGRMKGGIGQWRDGLGRRCRRSRRPAEVRAGVRLWADGPSDGLAGGRKGDGPGPSGRYGQQAIPFGRAPIPFSSPIHPRGRKPIIDGGPPRMDRAGSEERNGRNGGGEMGWRDGSSRAPLATAAQAKVREESQRLANQSLGKGLLRRACRTRTLGVARELCPFGMDVGRQGRKAWKGGGEGKPCLQAASTSCAKRLLQLVLAVKEHR